MKLEQDVVLSIRAICAQASKALTAHTRERDSWKLEADRAQAEARKLKNQLEEMAYKARRRPRRPRGLPGPPHLATCPARARLLLKSPNPWQVNGLAAGAL